MLVTSLNTTNFTGTVVQSNPVFRTLVAPVVVSDIGTITEAEDGTLNASIVLPLGATITNMQIYTTGTGSIWSGTPSWKVSVLTTGASLPATGNLVNGLSSDIAAYGDVQDLLPSSWVTYGNALNVAEGKSIYLYTAAGTFVIPSTATAVFRVFYYVTP